jgi:hypothetical protein
MFTFSESFEDGIVLWPRSRSLRGDNLHYHMSCNNARSSLNAIDTGLLVGTQQEMELEATRLRRMRSSRGMTSVVSVVEVL